MSMRVLVSLLALIMVPFMSVDAHHQEQHDPPGRPEAVVVHWADVAAQGGSAVINAGPDEDGQCASIRGRISFAVNESGERALGFERMPGESCRFHVQATEEQPEGDGAGPYEPWCNLPCAKRERSDEAGTDAPQYAFCRLADGWTHTVDQYKPYTTEVYTRTYVAIEFCWNYEEVEVFDYQYHCMENIAWGWYRAGDCDAWVPSAVSDQSVYAWAWGEDFYNVLPALAGQTHSIDTFVYGGVDGGAACDGWVYGEYPSEFNTRWEYRCGATDPEPYVAM